MGAVDDAAERLYGAPLGDFVAERKKAAAEVRATGDRPGAAAIGALPKPSTSAWIVDLLARERPEVIDSLADLGAALRAAQDDLDPDALRSLGDQRRRLVAHVAADAMTLAADRGQRGGASIRDEVEQTLQAALADEPALEAVRTGRLVRSLAAAGFDAVDLDGAVAGEGPVVRRTSARFSGSARSDAGEEHVDDLAARRREKKLREAREALADAQARLESARADAATAEEKREAADRRRTELTTERDELRARLEGVEEALSRAGSEARSSASRMADAAEAVADAEDAVTRAQRHLDTLDS